MIKRIAVFMLVIGLVTGYSVLCQAADPPAKDYNWTGLYAGLNIGWAGGDADVATNTVFSSTGYFAHSSPPAIGLAGAKVLSGDNVTGGGQVGYNWQSTVFVVGAELDFNSMNLGESNTCTAGYPCCLPTSFTIHSQYHTDWLLTARPRVGIAFDKLLLYVTGGLALTELESNFTFTDTFASMYETSKDSSLKVGWAFGTGIEVAIMKNWSIRGEYLHAGFGKMTSHSIITAGIPGDVAVAVKNPFTHSVDFSANMVRLGLNYRF